MAAGGDVAGAAPILARVAAARPEHAHPLADLARLLDGRGRGAAAEAHFRAGLALAPEEVRLRLAFGEYLLARGRSARRRRTQAAAALRDRPWRSPRRRTCAGRRWSPAATWRGRSEASARRCGCAPEGADGLVQSRQGARRGGGFRGRAPGIRPRLRAAAARTRSSGSTGRSPCSNPGGWKRAGRRSRSGAPCRAMRPCRHRSAPARTAARAARRAHGPAPARGGLRRHAAIHPLCPAARGAGRAGAGTGAAGARAHRRARRRHRGGATARRAAATGRFRGAVPQPAAKLRDNTGDDPGRDPLSHGRPRWRRSSGETGSPGCRGGASASSGRARHVRGIRRRWPRTGCAACRSPPWRRSPRCRREPGQPAEGGGGRRPTSRSTIRWREVRDFADTAGIIANLDAVVTVDTAVAHLAGGMGKPVFLLDRYDNCWRWLHGRRRQPVVSDASAASPSPPRRLGERGRRAAAALLTEAPELERETRRIAGSLNHARNRG